MNNHVGLAITAVVLYALFGLLIKHTILRWARDRDIYVIADIIGLTWPLSIPILLGLFLLQAVDNFIGKLFRTKKDNS